jgi:hypothetical protein
MTSTRSDIETQIADDLARSDLSSQITAAVNTAIRSYRFERLGFNEAYKVTATLSTSADVMTLDSLSVRFRKLDRVRIVRAAGDYLDLYHRDYDWIMSRQDVRVTCQPVEYAVYNSALHFDSMADQDYTLLLDGLKELGSAASASYSAGDTSAWFNDARELIRHRAKRELYANVLKDMELAAAAGAAEKEALRILKAEMGEQISTGFIRPTEF